MIFDGVTLALETNECGMRRHEGVVQEAESPPYSQKIHLLSLPSSAHLLVLHNCETRVPGRHDGS